MTMKLGLATGAVLFGASAGIVPACDLCAVYAATEARGEAGRGLYAGAAEQFTHFGTVQVDGHPVPNVAGQWLDSSISQVFAGYNFGERFGVQFDLPVIARSFRRPEGFAIDRGTEAGLGDVSLLGHWLAVQRETVDGTIAWKILGGVKFPTGSPDRLREELNEVVVPGAPASGIHGHDLTLGTGSVDGLVGTDFSARWKRAFFSASVQYAIRTTGAIDYRFANDLVWAGGPGLLLLLNDTCTVSLQANVSGETKGLDTFAGTKANDTGVTAIYLGPEVLLTWQNKLSAALGVDVPVLMNTTALQVVPDWRVRASVVWRF